MLSQMPRSAISFALASSMRCACSMHGTPAAIIDSFEYNLGAGAADVVAPHLPGAAAGTTSATFSVVPPSTGTWRWTLASPITFDSLTRGSVDELETAGPSAA